MNNTSKTVDEKKVFSPSEAADYLGIGKTTAYAMFNEPDFPCFRIGRRKFVLWSDMYDWLRNKRSGHVSGKEAAADEEHQNR